MSDSKVDQLVDCLRFRPVATTAAQMREAADSIDTLRSQLASTQAQLQRYQHCEKHPASAMEWIATLQNELAEVRLKAGGYWDALTEIARRDSSEYCAEHRRLVRIARGATPPNAAIDAALERK